MGVFCRILLNGKMFNLSKIINSHIWYKVAKVDYGNKYWEFRSNIFNALVSFHEIEYKIFKLEQNKYTNNSIYQRLLKDGLIIGDRILKIFLDIIESWIYSHMHANLPQYPDNHRFVMLAEEGADRCEQAINSNDFKEKSIAITLALNLQHNTGILIKDDSGMTSAQFKELSNLNTEEWDKDLEEMGFGPVPDDMSEFLKERWEEKAESEKWGKNFLWYKLAQATTVVTKEILDELTRDDWININDIMVETGYDWRGADDAKEIFYRIVSRSGALDESIFPDHVNVIQSILGETGTIEEEFNSKDVMEMAKDYFGITDDIFEAGYILPEGSLLDFSGKREGGPSGSRSLDHRSIERAIPNEMGEWTKAMTNFGNIGAIRCGFYGSGVGKGYMNLDIMKEPTFNQYSVIRKVINDFAEDASIHLESGQKNIELNYGESATSPSTMKVNGDRVINDIKRFYSS